MRMGCFLLPYAVPVLFSLKPEWVHSHLITLSLRVHYEWLNGKHPHYSLGLHCFSVPLQAGSQCCESSVPQLWRACITSQVLQRLSANHVAFILGKNLPFMAHTAPYRSYSSCSQAFQGCVRPSNLCITPCLSQ